ncbi:hypothetical protein A2U01_0059351, partial [Trifolium medium]|nr:hypothetical protein [Trifolium medium]
MVEKVRMIGCLVLICHRATMGSIVVRWLLTSAVDLV